MYFAGCSCNDKTDNGLIIILLGLYNNINYGIISSRYLFNTFLRTPVGW